jgi:hypothetical protein
MLLPYWAAVSANDPDPTMVVPHHEGDGTDGDGGGSGDGDADGDGVDDDVREAVTDAGPGTTEIVMFTLQPSKANDMGSVRKMMFTRPPGVEETKGPGRLAVRLPVSTLGLDSGGLAASGSRYNSSVS